jgi:hypothetical protein
MSGLFGGWKSNPNKPFFPLPLPLLPSPPPLLLLLLGNFGAESNVFKPWVICTPCIYCLEKAAAMAILVLTTAIMFHTSFHGAISSRNYNSNIARKLSSLHKYREYCKFKKSDLIVLLVLLSEALKLIAPCFQ